MARKNAERQWRVSRTVLAYVIVFAICWLPQRIVYLLYVLEALMNASPAVCVRLISATRVISFISVLLNPIVYISTQRELRAQIRNSLCISKLRHWYGKWIRKPVFGESKIDRDSVIPPPSNVVSSDNRKDERIEMEMQVRPEVVVEKEDSSHSRLSPTGRPAFRMGTTSRPGMIVRKNSGGSHDFQATALNARRRDATIDEMKEEEAAAEESLEKEMERLAVLAEEEKKMEQDKRNENWFHVPVDHVISSKDNSGSGNKSSSSGEKSDHSSTKGENFEEFWMRWLQSGGADLLSPSNGELSSSDKEPNIADLGNIVREKIVTNPSNGVGETII